MTPGEKLLSDAQVAIAGMMVEHQRELNALAIREAKAKAEAAELQSEWQRRLLDVSVNEWRKLGMLGGKAS